MSHLGTIRLQILNVFHMLLCPKIGHKFYKYDCILLCPFTLYIFLKISSICFQDAPLCSHYAQNGVCKFGPWCKFNHPMRTLSYSPSASSLTDMPVAPYPVGSTNATLAPSSSSSNLRPELLAGFSKDAFSSNLSSMNSSSASVGSTFSKSGPIPQFSVQHSGQGSTSSTGGSSSSHGGEVRTSS